LLPRPLTQRAASATVAKNHRGRTVLSIEGTAAPTRATIGGRVTRLQDRSDQIDSLTTGAKTLVSGIEDVDLTTAISQFVQLQTALQAALAVGNKLQTSVLDFLQL